MARKGRPRGKIAVALAKEETEKRKNEFLKVFEETGNAPWAIKAISPHLDQNKPTSGLSTLRYWLQTDLDFAEKYDEARQTAASRLLEEMRRRGADGVPEVVVQKGQVVKDDDGNPVIIRRYSDKLLLALAKATMPEIFEDRRRHIHQVSFAGLSGFTLSRQDVNALTDQQQDQLRGILQTIRTARAKLLEYDGENDGG